MVAQVAAHRVSVDVSVLRDLIVTRILRFEALLPYDTRGLSLTKEPVETVIDLSVRIVIVVAFRHVWRVLPRRSGLDKLGDELLPHVPIEALFRLVGVLGGQGKPSIHKVGRKAFLC